MKAIGNKEEQFLREPGPPWEDDGMWLVARQWQTAFNAIRDAVCFLDPGGKILRCNVAMTKLLHKPFWDIVGQDCNNVLLCCRSGNRSRSGKDCPLARIKESRSREVLKLRVDGRTFDVVVDPVLSDDGVVGMVQVVVDVTERDYAQEKLQRSEEKLRVMFESIADGITVTDLKGNIVELNEAAVKLHGYSCKQELIGKYSGAFISAGDRASALKKLRKVRDNGRSGTVEFNALTRDGAEFDAEMSATLIRDKAGNPAGFIAVTKDITERKRAEEELERSREELRSLSAYLQTVREEERTTIAREIHDELGQSLTALKMDVSWLVKRLPAGELAMRDRARTMSELIDSTLKTVKRICSELRPAVLDHLGLAAAIEWQAGEFEKRTGTRCEVSIREENVKLEQWPATTVFRIFQEALTNVARHASATSVRVRLEESDGKLILEIADNGKGIAGEQIASSKSLGLIGMKERANSCGGEVIIRGRPGAGTTVTVGIPLEKKGVAI